MLSKFDITSVVRFSLLGAQIYIYIISETFGYFFPYQIVMVLKKESGKVGKNIHIMLSELRKTGV